MAFTYRICGREALGDIFTVRSLGEALLARNHFNDALDLFRSVHDVTRSSCGDISCRQGNSVVCQNCLDSFCEEYLKEVEEPHLTRFCVIGHRLLELAPGPHCDGYEETGFRGKQLRSIDCLVLIKEEC
jgi:hypothetical protein